MKFLEKAVYTPVNQICESRTHPDLQINSTNNVRAPRARVRIPCVHTEPSPSLNFIVESKIHVLDFISLQKPAMAAHPRKTSIDVFLILSFAIGHGINSFYLHKFHTFNKQLNTIGIYLILRRIPCVRLG